MSADDCRHWADEMRRTASAGTLEKAAAKLGELSDQMAAIDKALGDSGLPERDCSLPMPERVSNMLRELKSWRHQAAVLMKAEAERDDLTRKKADVKVWLALGFLALLIVAIAELAGGGAS